MRLVCINCPRGCELTVDERMNVSGQGCDRGREYAIAEVTNPVRTVTGLVKVEGQRQPLSVKTREPVPKSEIPAVLEALRNTVARRPVVLGQEILPNIVSTTAFP